ncbi:MAG: MoaD family protein [Candidatus Altiarchaeia archaeon]
MTLIHIPTPLRKFTKGESAIDGTGGTVKELLDDLKKNYPELSGRLLDEKGEVRKFLNVYVNKDDIRFLKGLGTEIKETDGISIVPAIAGG